MPDQRAHQHRIHGQIDISLNKKPKSTYLTQIMDHAKSVHGKRPGPSDYVPDLAFDYAKTATARKSGWSKQPREGFIHVIEKREKKMKGPSDYKPVIKSKIAGNYTQNDETSY